MSKHIFNTIGFIALLTAGQVQALNVGGVVWDPDAANDFTMQFNFTQWYTSSANAIDSTINLAPDFDNALAIPTDLVNNDSVLTGVGQVYSINGTNEATFCPSCELTTVFGGIKLVNAATLTFDLTNAFVNLYVDSTPDYPWPSDAGSQSDADAAADGILWLSLSIEDWNLSGNLNAGFVDSLLNVDSGLAASNFVSGTIFGFDAEYAGSAFSAPGDKYSTAGNGQFRSDTIPEPTSIALIGLGILALGAVRRRNAAQNL